MQTVKRPLRKIVPPLKDRILSAIAHNEASSMSFIAEELLIARRCVELLIEGRIPLSSDDKKAYRDTRTVACAQLARAGIIKPRMNALGVPSVLHGGD
jgi:hypothetical protein